MRIHLVHGLAVITALVAAACQSSYPQQPQDPVNANPKPQQPINHPEPQAFGAGLEPKPQGAMNDPSRQGSALGEPKPQEAITHPEPQKPFYGPGLTPPDERAEARAKSQAPLTSDGEVLSAAMAIDDGELQMAELAKKNASSPEVKQLATAIANEHQKSMTKIRDVQGKAKIQLVPNDVTTELKDQTAQKMSVLRGKSGKDFDRYYVDTQVRMHQQVLDVIDERMMPGAQSGQVKSTLSTLRDKVHDHLSKSKSLLEKIDPTAAAAFESESKGTKTESKKAKGDDEKKKSDEKKK